MSVFRKIVVVMFAIICLAGATPKAQAQMLQEKIDVTFSAPVEVPGRVLPPGTYVFTALEPSSLTRISSLDERIVYGTFFTVSEERREPVEKATIILGENTEGAPERVQAWFYPGDSVGSAFIYREPSSHNSLLYAVDATGRAIDSAATHTAKAGEHIVVNSGKAAGHAVKYLVS